MKQSKEETASASNYFHSVAQLVSWVPFIRTIQTYGLSKFRFDLAAGLTIALVALPQCMAYALIAGVEPRYGIYALIVGSVIGSLFGSSRYLHTGPTNTTCIVIAALMTPFLHHDNYMAMLFLLSFLTGLFQFGAGLLGLGKLTQFISRSVLVGFTCGASLLIISSQIPNLLGLPKMLGFSALNKVFAMYKNFGSLDVITLTIGVSTILFVLTLNRLSPKSSDGVSYIPSSLLAVIGAASAVALMGLVEKGVPVVGAVPATLPPLSAPSFEFDAIRSLATSALALALISTAEATASSKSTAALAGEKVQANQEFIGQGLAKMGVAFFSGMPVSGSFTRTALNFRAGAQTRFAGVFSGIIVIMVVLLFSPIMKYIPVAALAGIIMVIAVKMIPWKHAMLTVKATKPDAVAMLATFVATLLFSLDTAIYIGVGLSLVLFLREVQHPRLIELEYDEANGFQEVEQQNERSIPEISIIHLEGDIFFGAAEFLEEEIGKIAARKAMEVLILRVKSAYCLDATSIMSLIQFIEYMKRNEKLLIVSGVTGEVEEIFRRTGLDKLIGEENIFFSDTAVLKSTREALGRALDYVNSKGDKKYRLRLFYDKPEKARIASEEK